jgi:UPF0042 nucleotide-binding protein
LCFPEARDEVVGRRFSVSRRPHPLAQERSIGAAIRMERRRLHKLRELADVTIDTSDCTVHQVKALVAQRFHKHPRESALKVILLSFGYKRGIPLEADLVFDVRFLPNPFFVPRLKAFSGRDRKVKAFMRKFSETKEFVKRVEIS